MKILILRNNFTWDLDKKLTKVSKFFKPVRDIEFVVEQSSYKDIPHEPCISTPNSLGLTITFNKIGGIWYDTHISLPARDRGFDCVIFLQEPKEYKGSPAQGYRTHNNLVIQEIVAQAKKKGSYNYCGASLKGDQLTWILIHELLHAFYLKENKFDNTHKWFTERKPEMCLNDFKSTQNSSNLPKNRWKHFRPEEKTGTLGHTISELDPTFVDKLDLLREKCGFPLVGNSGYRTVEENASVGGKQNSAHIKRIAIDIACIDPMKRMKIVGEAYLMGFIGIGIDKVYVHLDMDTSNTRRIWLY